MTLLSPALEHRLLNEFQSGFPLTANPYAVIGKALGLDEARVIAALDRLVGTGTVSRVGATFRPGTVGVSTLAALAVSDADLERVADLVSARPEVNHNYEREHAYNLWFVVTAPHRAALERALAAIARDSGKRLLSLPLVDDYRIDLAFDIGGDLRHRSDAQHRRQAVPTPLSATDRALANALEPGLALMPKPYARLAAQAGMCEATVLERLSEWLERGILRRLGIIVRHRALGFRANAMCVWDVPDEAVSALGTALAAEPGVTLCYRRERARPHWPYNLFCMIHGRERDAVRARIAELESNLGLHRFAGDVLFSRRAFKQRGARYGLVETNPVRVAAAGTLESSTHHP